LENQQYIKAEADEWDAEFLTRFTAWQVRVQEMLHRTISIPAPAGNVVPPVAQIADGEQPFDVFLSYNSEDRPTVLRIAQQLEQKGIKVWLDQHELRPGTSWLKEVDAQVRSVRSVAILVGATGIGPWQDVEIQGFIHTALDRDIPVIPVLLHNAVATPELPFYLRPRTYIDFRKNDPHPLKQLVWGIKGIKDKFL
jgi:nucleotide-binding universal stress UspA family protein